MVYLLSALPTTYSRHVDRSSVEVPCVFSSQGCQPLTVLSMICRCSAALVTEVQTARTAGGSAAKLGSLQSRAQERPDLKEVESLEALWAPRSSDDSRAMLEQSAGSSGRLRILLRPQWCVILPPCSDAWKHAPCTALLNGTVILWWASVQHQDSSSLHMQMQSCGGRANLCPLRATSYSVALRCAVVALSGGTGSALVAYLVASVFEESTILCIGKSAALDPVKLQRARFVADLLGVLPMPLTLWLH